MCIRDRFRSVRLIFPGGHAVQQVARGTLEFRGERGERVRPAVEFLLGVIQRRVFGFPHQVFPEEQGEFHGGLPEGGVGFPEHRDVPDSGRCV